MSRVKRSSLVAGGRAHRHAHGDEHTRAVHWCMVVVCATTSMKWSSGLEVIDTVAGTGVLGFNGDGITATAASLYNPAGVSALYNASSDGVILFISDSYSHRIRRVNEGGIITTVAGTGAQGYSGDGGAATAARLRFPRGLSAMSSLSVGNVDMYIADFSNHCVRHVNNAGIITTVAGNGTLGFSGDGGPATAAQLHEPWDVSALYNASSGGMVLYVADTNNRRIRRVNEVGIISTMAGTGGNGYTGDGGLATAALMKSPTGVSAMFNTSSGGVVLFITDYSNHRIRRVNEAGLMASVAGTLVGSYSGDGGPATAAHLNFPSTVATMYNATGGSVVLYVVDRGNNRIRFINETGFIRTVAGNGTQGFSGDHGPATAAMLGGAAYISAVYNASSKTAVVFIVEGGGQRIRRIHTVADPTSTPSASASATGSATGTASSTSSATGTPTPTPTPSSSMTATSTACSSPTASPSTIASTTSARVASPDAGALTLSVLLL